MKTGRCEKCGNRTAIVNPFTNIHFCGCTLTPNPQSDMSERKDRDNLIRYASNYWENLPGHVQDRQQGQIYKEMLEALKADRAALNQPAPCGPGLTAAMVRAIESARNVFRQHEVEYRRLAEDRGQLDDRYHAYKDVERNCKEDADALDNLLARDAKADTVTLRREVVEELLDLFRGTTYQLSKCDVGMGEDWEERRERVIAEAEAALAKGARQ